MVCGAKGIRSIYLPSPKGRPPGLSSTTPPKAPASLSTINAATMRLCRADLPATAHSSRLPFGAAQGPEPVEETPENARLPAGQNGAAPGAGMVCGAKGIRSLQLPWMTGVTPKLSSTTPPKAPASLSTIKAATMRLCGADHPASRHAAAAGGSCIMRVKGMELAYSPVQTVKFVLH